MVYFFINLFFHLLISIGLLLLILRFASNNKKRKNKKGISYLLPVVLTVIFLFQAVTATAPRILDSVYVLKNNLNMATGKVESVGYLNHALKIEGVSYYYDPFFFKPQQGDLLDITFTPYAHYAFVIAPAK